MSYVYTQLRSTCYYFLALAVNSNWFQILQSHMLLLKPSVLMHSCTWYIHQVVSRSQHRHEADYRPSNCLLPGCVLSWYMIHSVHKHRHETKNKPSVCLPVGVLSWLVWCTKIVDPLSTPGCVLSWYRVPRCQSQLHSPPAISEIPQECRGETQQSN